MMRIGWTFPAGGNYDHNFGGSATFRSSNCNSMDLSTFRNSVTTSMRVTHCIVAGGRSKTNAPNSHGVGLLASCHLLSARNARVARAHGKGAGGRFMCA